MLFLFSCQPQIWSFHVVVVHGQHNAHAELLFYSENVLCFRCSYRHWCHGFKGSLTYNASRSIHAERHNKFIIKCSQTKLKAVSNVFWSLSFYEINKGSNTNSVRKSSDFSSLIYSSTWQKKLWTSSDHLPPYCKSTNQLVPKRLTLRNCTQTSCGNFLCIQLEKTLV